MANLAALLKQEISRLIRKELRPETEALKKAAARHRAEVAEMKRRIAELERQLKASSRQARPASGEATEPESGRQIRFRADGLKKHRERLGLSPAALGALLDVSLQTIYNWESGKTRPRPAQIAKIARLRTMGKREVQAQVSSAKA